MAPRPDAEVVDPGAVPAAARRLVPPGFLHAGELLGARPQPGGNRWLLLGDGAARVYDTGGDHPRLVGLLRVGAALRDGALDRSGERVALLTPDGLLAWDLEQGTFAWRATSGRWRALAWHRSGEVVLGGDHGRIEVQSVDGLARQVVSAGDGKVTRLLTSPRGDQVAAVVAHYMNTAYLSRLERVRVMAWEWPSGRVRLDEQLEGPEDLQRRGLHYPGADAGVELAVDRAGAVWARRWTREGPRVRDVTHGRDRIATAFPLPEAPVFAFAQVRHLGLRCRARGARADGLALGDGGAVTTGRIGWDPRGDPWFDREAPEDAAVVPVAVPGGFVLTRLGAPAALRPWLRVDLSGEGAAVLGGVPPDRVFRRLLDVQGGRALFLDGRGQLAELDLASGEDTGAFGQPHAPARAGAYRGSDALVASSREGVALVPAGGGPAEALDAPRRFDRLVVPGGRPEAVGLATREDELVLLELAGAGGRTRLEKPFPAAAVRSLAASPDGRLLVMGCEDWTVRLFDRRRRIWSPPLSGHHGAVEALAFGPGGEALASAGGDGSVLVWDLPELRRRLGMA